MSEAERKKRQDYKENRLKWILIQIVALVVVVIIAIGSFIVYDNMNRTYYIQYTESGNAGYMVHNKNFEDDEFLTDEWFESGSAYISDNVDFILGDFKYELHMDAEDVGFDYKYSVVANMVLTDTTTNKPIYAPVYELLPEKVRSVKGNSISIREAVTIDYEEYDRLANEFIASHKLNKISASLVVKLNVDVLSSCEEFEQNGANSYFTSINIPLTTNTFDVKSSNSTPTQEAKVLACSSAVNQNVFLIAGIVTSILALLQGGALIAFMYLTRNEDIKYAGQVKKILSAYRSFIQQIDGEFNTDNYQEIHIKTFVELLGIRDTIQSPILMSENLDQTCTKFLIPTATNLLYTYELKVENYDEIYNTPKPEIVMLTQEESESIEDSVIAVTDEEVQIDETVVDSEEVAKAWTIPDVVLSEIEYDMDDDDDFAVSEDEPGIEVVGVVWPERPHHNNVYRYDPNGEMLEEGDVVLVPTRDKEREREVVRKAAVAHSNHRVQPEHIKHPLKKIIGVVRRKFEVALTNDKDE